MEVTLYRYPGSCGRLVALDVLVNASKVATIAEGETKRIHVSAPALMRVEMQQTVSSQEYRLSENDSNRLFHCGTNFWVMLDLFDFAYLPVLSKRVLFIRRQEQTTDV